MSPDQPGIAEHGKQEPAVLNHGFPVKQFSVQEFLSQAVILLCLLHHK
jgi:hypothetical protein